MHEEQRLSPLQKSAATGEGFLQSSKISCDRCTRRSADNSGQELRVESMKFLAVSQSIKSDAWLLNPQQPAEGRITSAAGGLDFGMRSQAP